MDILPWALLLTAALGDYRKNIEEARAFFVENEAYFSKELRDAWNQLVATHLDNPHVPAILASATTVNEQIARERAKLTV